MTFDAAHLRFGGAKFRGEPMRLVLFTAFASLTLAAPAGAADLFGSAPPPSFPAAQPPTAIESRHELVCPRRRRGLLRPVAQDSGWRFRRCRSSWRRRHVQRRDGRGISPATSGSAIGSTTFCGSTRPGITGPARAGRAHSAVVCPYGLQGVTNPLTGAPAGYLYDPDQHLRRHDQSQPA